MEKLLEILLKWARSPISPDQLVSTMDFQNSRIHVSIVICLLMGLSQWYWHIKLITCSPKAGRCRPLNWWDTVPTVVSVGLLSGMDCTDISLGVGESAQTPLRNAAITYFERCCLALCSSGVSLSDLRSTIFFQSGSPVTQKPTWKLFRH